jgi:hypothetical protein
MRPYLILGAIFLFGSLIASFLLRNNTALVQITIITSSTGLILLAICQAVETITGKKIKLLTKKKY